MIPLCEPDLRGNEARYLAECVASNYVSSVGPFVSRFEDMLRDATGRSGSVATSSGTAALHATLTALGVGPGDAVVMQALTFVATANAASYCGATPIFLDITPESWTLDPAELARLFDTECARAERALMHRATGKRIAAVIVVHTVGHPADMAALEAVCGEHHVPLVADAAAAIGATYRGSPVSARGTAACISFNGNKTITCGGGGAVVSDDEVLVNAVRHLTTTARVSTDYRHDRVGFNYRMTNVHAAIGCAQLERLSELVARKRTIADQYDRAFHDIPGLEPFPRAEWSESACWFSGFVVTDVSSYSAEAIVRHLNAAGIGARRFWRPMHLQPMYADCPRSTLGVTERIWPNIVTLPCSTGLSSSDQATVISAVRQLFACSNPSIATSPALT